MEISPGQGVKGQIFFTQFFWSQGFSEGKILFSDLGHVRSLFFLAITSFSQKPRKSASSKLSPTGKTWLENLKTTWGGQGGREALQEGKFYFGKKPVQATPAQVQQLWGKFSPAFCLAKHKQEAGGTGQPHLNGRVCVSKSQRLCKLNEPVSRWCRGHLSIIEMQPPPVWSDKHLTRHGSFE